MGVVYEVRSPGISAPRALKLLPGVRAEAKAEARFQREAETLAQIRHPGVLRVHEVGVASQGRFLVTELIAGESLEDVSKRGPVASELALAWIAELADAVQALHAAGLVHRDLKPENVILRPDGRLVLLDFGLARSAGSSPLTATGTISGSPAYLSPEQAVGQRVITPACDVHGLGVTLFALLSGQPPFLGSSLLALVAQVCGTDLSWPPTLDAPLRAVLSRSVAKDPAARYQDAGEFRSALLAARAQQAPGARLPFLPLLGFAVALGLGAALVWPQSEARISLPTPLASARPTTSPTPPLSYRLPAGGSERALWFRRLWTRARAEADPRAREALERAQGEPLWELQPQRGEAWVSAVPWGREHYAIPIRSGVRLGAWTPEAAVELAAPPAADPFVLRSAGGRLFAFEWGGSRVSRSEQPGAPLSQLELPGLPADAEIQALALGDERWALTTEAEVLTYSADLRLLEQGPAPPHPADLVYLSTGELVVAGRGASPVVVLAGTSRPLPLQPLALAADSSSARFAIGCKAGGILIGSSPFEGWVDLRAPILDSGPALSPPPLRGLAFAPGGEFLWTVEGFSSSDPRGSLSLWARKGASWEWVRSQRLEWCPTHLVVAGEGAWLLISGQGTRVELWPGAPPPGPAPGK